MTTSQSAVLILGLQAPQALHPGGPKYPGVRYEVTPSTTNLSGAQDTIINQVSAMDPDEIQRRKSATALGPDIPSIQQ